MTMSPSRASSRCPGGGGSGRAGGRVCAATAEAGHECFEYRPGYGPGRKISWAERQRRVDRWLGSLPRPIAVLAVDAYHARQLAEICHFAKVRVPDEVAILADATPEAFGRGILTAIDRPEAARAIGQRARHLAETKYSYDAYLTRTRQAVAHLTKDAAAQVAGGVA